MSAGYDDLMQFLSESGISTSDADSAAKRCLASMVKRGVGGYAAGGVVAYFLAMNPAAAIPYLVGGLALGAGHALAEAEACSDVRQAVRYWIEDGI